GPNIGTTSIKPEVVAPGLPLYMATQRLDPNGALYEPSGWVASQGTSFAAPIAAGVAAIFKQRFPNATPAQIKSGVVNSASADTIDGTLISPARVTAMGAGKVNVNDTSRATLIVEPATLSFGNVGVTAPTPQTLTFRNVGDPTITVRIDNRPRDFSNSARVTLSTLAFPLAPGATQQVVATLQGTPSAGSYEGELVAAGGTTSIRVPYLYMRSDNVLFDAFPLTSYFFEGIVNAEIPGPFEGLLALKAIDQYGLPVANLPVQYRVTLGSGEIVTASSTTDNLGIAAVNEGNLGAEVGDQEFTADVGTGSNKISVVFPGRARLRPTIRTDGVVDAAGATIGRGLAPGSYISIFGQNLSDVTRVGVTASLPLSLAGISVSFDVPTRQLSLPGRLHFVSPTQINVQIPWELTGLNSAFMKVSIGDYSSALYTVPLNNVSPNAFEFTDPGTGRRLAAALDSNFALIYDANKAKKGQFIQVYVNGLGDVDNTPPSGEPSSANPLSRTTTAPVVTIGGRPAEVVFSGLAPGIVGLYQINVRVPADAPSGLQPLIIQMGDVTSKTANLPVE
ncbi:MAG: S8 family serine peptidase, partial [Acidobacteriota bacterium]